MIDFTKVHNGVVDVPPEEVDYVNPRTIIWSGLL